MEKHKTPIPERHSRLRQYRSNVQTVRVAIDRSTSSIIALKVAVWNQQKSFHFFEQRDCIRIGTSRNLQRNSADLIDITKQANHKIAQNRTNNNALRVVDHAFVVVDVAIDHCHHHHQLKRNKVNKQKHEIDYQSTSSGCVEQSGRWYQRCRCRRWDERWRTSWRLWFGA